MNKVYIETYGCQMNSNDSEVILSVLEHNAGFCLTPNAEDADLAVINTCAIRDNAEQRIWGRIDYLQHVVKKTNKKLKIALVGCMAQRLKDQLEGHVDIVAGPDAYRNLPELWKMIQEKSLAINTTLDRNETYDNILPSRLDHSGIAAYISIMRGCNNVCSYCIVPYTRGAERSCPVDSIISQAKDIIAKGYKEICLLGQNVDSYNYEGTTFAQLIEMVAELDRTVRVRFSTSHPKDISDELIYTIARNENICKHIHLPLQSGNTEMLEKMRRRYSREWYLERVHKIREVIPGCGLSTDVIAGFSGETPEQHADTLSLMEEVCFDSAFMFAYSERPGTLASRIYPDDISQELKVERLNEIIALQSRCSLRSNQKNIGEIFEVLVEGPSKKNPDEYCGRASNNKMCVFPAPKSATGEVTLSKGDYVKVKVESVTSATLLCSLV